MMLEGELRVTKYFGEQEIFLGNWFPGNFLPRSKSCSISRFGAHSGSRR